MDKTAQWAEDQKKRGRILIAVKDDDVDRLIESLAASTVPEVGRLRATLEGAAQAHSVGEAVA